MLNCHFLDRFSDDWLLGGAKAEPNKSRKGRVEGRKGRGQVIVKGKAGAGERWIAGLRRRGHREQGRGRIGARDTRQISKVLTRAGQRQSWVQVCLCPKKALFPALTETYSSSCQKTVTLTLVWKKML